MISDLHSVTAELNFRFTYLLLSLWKILLFLCCLFVIAPAANIVPDLNFLFSNFGPAFRSQEFSLAAEPGLSFSPVGDAWLVSFDPLHLYGLYDRSFR